MNGFVSNYPVDIELLSECLLSIPSLTSAAISAFILITWLP